MGGREPIAQSDVCRGSGFGRGKRMSVTQIIDEIRKLNRIDKIEIFRWLDREVANDLGSRIGIDRSIQIRRDLERRVTSPERQAAWKGRVNLSSTEQGFVNWAS
jgi:hypothetical protein